MITVLVVDDQSLIRQAVTDILTGEDGIEVAGEAVNGRQAVRLARELTPDVIVMDIRMPDLDGIGATAEICADPNLAVTKVLILTTFEEDENLIAALRAGASGFVGKGAEPEEIVRAVRAVHAGDALLSPTATRNLIDRFISVAPGQQLVLPELKELTEREHEVFLAVVRGQSVIIAYETGLITPGT